MNLGQVLFGFSGRINRAKYWLSVVIWTVAWIVAVILLTMFIARDLLNVPDLSNMSGQEALRVFVSAGLGGMLFILIVLIPMIVSGFAVGIKRLHDRNKSGWLLLFFYFGPWVIKVVRGLIASGIVSTVLVVLEVVIAIWAIVELGFLRGTRGPNSYGPDPLPPDA